MALWLEYYNDGELDTAEHGTKTDKLSPRQFPQSIQSFISTIITTGTVSDTVMAFKVSLKSNCLWNFLSFVQLSSEIGINQNKYLIMELLQNLLE